MLGKAKVVCKCTLLLLTITIMSECEENVSVAESISNREARNTST